MFDYLESTVYWALDSAMGEFDRDKFWEEAIWKMTKLHN